MPDALVNFTGGATVVVGGAELLQPYIDASRASADNAQKTAALLAGLTGVMLPRRDLVIVGGGDSHTNGHRPDGGSDPTGPLDATWSGTARDGYFRRNAAINSMATPFQSNDQAFAQVTYDQGSWLGSLPAALRASYPSLGKLTVANVAAGGSSAYTWAGEQAYGYVRAFALPIEGDTVTIGGTVYTFRGAPSAIGDVLIGATKEQCILYLENAVNAEGEGFFPGTPANEHVWGAEPVADPFGRFAALYSGAAGNGIVISSSSTDRISATLPDLSAAASANMTGGADQSALYRNARAALGTLRPDVWTCTLGTNDCNRPGYRARGMQAELVKMVARIRADYPAAKIILNRPPVIGTGALAVAALADRVLPAIAATVAANPGVVSPVDYYGLGTGPDGAGKLIDITTDIHPTDYGYAVMAQLFARGIAEALAL